jgi:hypothetical protein
MKANLSAFSNQLSATTNQRRSNTMKTVSIIILVILCLCLPGIVLAQVPQMINYQGRVSVGGTNFDGTGQFQFALVDSAGTTNYWSNDGTPTGEPGTAVSLSVTKGLYAVLLGDTNIANMATSIPATVFTNSDVCLRVWFDDGVSGLQQLSPDQRLAAAGYALQAQNATVANGVSPFSIVQGQALNIGSGNTLGGAYASVAGGSNNFASGSYSFIGGGECNTATNNEATVAGGSFNIAGGNSATVGGGAVNTASGNYATVGGGYTNTASGIYATVGGGEYNTATSNEATVAGGSYNTANGTSATVGGGYRNIAGNSYATVGGGYTNTAGGTSATVGGGEWNSIQNSARDATIGGGGTNSIRSSAYYSTIGGGVSNTIQSSASASTIGGGEGNLIQSGTDATIGGGEENIVSAKLATIPGGHHAAAANYAQMAYSSGLFAALGDGQFSLYVLRGQTMGSNTTATLYLDYGTGSSQEIALPANRACAYTLRIVGRSSVAAGGLCCAFCIRGAANGNTAAVNNLDTASVLNEFAPGFNPTPVISVVGGKLRVQVFNAPNDTVRWTATVETAEVAYP